MNEPQKRLDPFGQLNNRWKDFEKNLKACGEEFDEENVHDLRVSIRRLLSAIRIFEVSVPDSAVKRASRELKRIFDQFGELRDAQVQLAYLAGLRDEFPEIWTFLAYLGYEENRLKEDLAANLQSALPSIVETGIRRLNDKRKEFKLELAVFEIERLFQKVRMFRDVVESKDPKLLHKMRIAFKRYRYAVEFVSELLGVELGEDDKYSGKTRHYHDLLGNIQDLETLTQKLARYQTQSGGVGDALSEIETRRVAAIDKFLAESKGFFKLGDKVYPYVRDAVIGHLNGPAGG